MKPSQLIVVVLLASSAVSEVLAQSVATDALSGVRVEYEPLFVSRSHALVRLSIHNASGKRRQWVVESDATQYRRGRVVRSSRFELEVEDGQSRVFELLVPVQDHGQAGWVQWRIFGYGILHPGNSHSWGATTAGDLAVSTTLGEGESAPELARALGTVQSVSVGDFPEDWRAFEGFDTVWLSPDEWERMAPSPRRALREWIARGHKLVLVDPSARPDDPITPYGLGAVVSVPPSVSQTDQTYRSAVQTSLGGDPASWAPRVMPRIEAREGLLTLVLLGYVVVVGPVNLLVFAPRRKRLRLFWTMPSIALGASAMLAAIIVLQDGVGGAGRRADFVILMPELKKELVVQEQVSRTGALLSRRFELPDGTLLTDVTGRGASSRLGLENAGTSYHGDWFRSRSIQVHRLELSRPSRARIDWVETAEEPTILSSIEGRLEMFYFRDEAGDCWRGENILPGRPARLMRISDADYAAWRQARIATLGPRIGAHLETAARQRGAFLAAAEPETSLVPIETLSSIDWQQDAVLYAGRLERAER